MELYIHVKYILLDALQVLSMDTISVLGFQGIKQN